MKKELKEFKKLSSKEQQIIRKNYKKQHFKEYRKSINLFIFYTIVGILGIISLVIGLLIQNKIFIFLYILIFLILLILLYLLDKSNEPFYKFLNKKIKKTINK